MREDGADVKFRTKLYVGFGTVLVLMLVLSYGGFMLLQQLNSSMKRIVNDNYAGVKLATSIREEMSAIGREMSAYMLGKGMSDSMKHANAIANSRMLIEKYRSELNRLEPGDKHAETLTVIFNAYDIYSRDVDHLLQLTRDGMRAEALDYYNATMEPARSSLFDNIAAFSLSYEEDIEQVLDSSRESYLAMLAALAVFVILILAISVAIVSWVFRSVTGSLGRVAAAMNGVAGDDSNSLPFIPVDADDEIGDIAKAYNQMAIALDIHSRESLSYQKALEAQSWHKTKVAEFSAMFQNVQDERELAHLFLSEMAPITKAGYGALYARRTEEGSDAGLYKLASYAASGEEAFERRIALGEGLVGQCALQNKPIALNDIPPAHVRVRSGLGESRPVNLLLTPIPYDGKAVAVLELASHTPYEPAPTALLEEIAGLLGTALDSASAYRQISRLLAESQTHAKELQAQSEELQMQQEELRTLNEQLEEQNHYVEGKNLELETARRALEENTRQAQLSSRYKSEFLANVSHELRTPLNSLLLLAQLLADNKENNLLPKQLEYMRTIYGSGVDLLRLINDLLDLSKIEAGKAEVVPGSVSVGELAATAERRFRMLVAEKGLELRVDLPPGGTDAVIRTDIQKLQQIISNLLSNAIKFTERGGVTISFQLASEGHKDNAGRWKEREIAVVSVTDTGIGIPPDKQDMIFEAFRQADGTTSRKYGGTGLGLSICRELAALLGGTIGLASEENKGSTFTLRLPQMDEVGFWRDAPAFAESAAAKTHAPAAESNRDDTLRRLANKTILLVDDDMRNIFALTSVLESYGMTVLFAENGREGLNMLERYPDVDLVLMDIMMPQMDGFEAIKTIRGGESAQRNIPIIALTAKAMKADRDHCLEAGANDYISKPIHNEQLLSLLRVWLHD